VLLILVSTHSVDGNGRTADSSVYYCRFLYRWVGSAMLGTLHRSLSCSQSVRH
jgi:hypothetical protein